jgi:acetyl esterase/lipase
MYALLALINFLSPKEWGSRRVAHGIHYGPEGRQVLDIYAPRSGSGPWPVIYFVYGGSWNMGERSYYGFVGRALAALGYLVVIPDYRLIPEVEYPLFLDDCADGFRWTVANIGSYGGDADRMALMGHSAGAYNAVMLVLAQRHFPALELVSPVRAVVGLSGPYDFYPFDVAVSLRAFGAVADPKSTQPVNLARAGLPPMFLASGEADKLVYPRNTKALSARLRAAGNIVIEKYYPKLGHAGALLALGAFGRRRAPILVDVAAFLRQHL